jgi:hypothetical protein
MTTYTIKLTPTERKALDLADAVGWQGYYLQYEDADGNLLDADRWCYENDATEEDLRREIAAAKASEIADDHLTLVPSSSLEQDIAEKLDGELVGFQAILTENSGGKPMVRAIRSVLRKLTKANPELNEILGHES